MSTPITITEAVSSMKDAAYELRSAAEDLDSFADDLQTEHDASVKHVLDRDELMRQIDQLHELVEHVQGTEGAIEGCRTYPQPVERTHKAVKVNNTESD